MKNNTIKLLVALGILLQLESCEQKKKDIDPIASVSLVTGISEIGNVTYTVVNEVTMGTNETFAFRLNVVAPKSFQSIEVSRSVYNYSNGNTSVPKLIYLGISGYDTYPYIGTRVLANTLSTTPGGPGGIPSGYQNPTNGQIPLIETGLSFSSSYLTTSAGFVLRTGNQDNVIEKYLLKVKDNYGRETNSYLNINIPQNNIGARKEQ